MPRPKNPRKSKNSIPSSLPPDSSGLDWLTFRHSRSCSRHNLTPKSDLPRHSSGINVKTERKFECALSSTPKTPKESTTPRPVSATQHFKPEEPIISIAEASEAKEDVVKPSTGKPEGIIERWPQLDKQADGGEQLTTQRDLHFRGDSPPAVHPASIPPPPTPPTASLPASSTTPSSAPPQLLPSPIISEGNRHKTDFPVEDETMVSDSEKSPGSHGDTDMEHDESDEEGDDEDLNDYIINNPVGFLQRIQNPRRPTDDETSSQMDEDED